MSINMIEKLFDDLHIQELAEHRGGEMKEYILVIINLNYRERFYDYDEILKRKKLFEESGYEVKIYSIEFMEEK